MNNLFKIILLILLAFNSFDLLAQKVKKQEFGINAAGLVVKNQAVVAPSFIYKYKINDYQIRAQFAFDSRINNDDRKGYSTQKQTSFTTQRDTAIDYEPSRNSAIGILLGFQYNSKISHSNFNYFYGMDCFYMLKESGKKGQGTATLTQSTTTQNTVLKSEISNKLKTYGMGIPMGISYYWDKRFYASIEAKFVIAYQTNISTVKSEFEFTQQLSAITTTSGSKTTSYGFDIGIKPLTGLCFGIMF